MNYEQIKQIVDTNPVMEQLINLCTWKDTLNNVEGYWELPGEMKAIAIAIDHEIENISKTYLK